MSAIIDLAVQLLRARRDVDEARAALAERQSVLDAVQARMDEARALAPTIGLFPRPVELLIKIERRPAR